MVKSCEWYIAWLNIVSLLDIRFSMLTIASWSTTRESPRACARARARERERERAKSAILVHFARFVHRIVGANLSRFYLSEMNHDALIIIVNDDYELRRINRRAIVCNNWYSWFEAIFSRTAIIVRLCAYVPVVKISHTSGVYLFVPRARYLHCRSYCKSNVSIALCHRIYREQINAHRSSL